MDNTEQASMIAFGVGAVALAAAAIGVLLRRTTGPTGTRRLGAMAQLAAAAMWGLLPSRCAVMSTVAGLFAFAGSWATGVVVAALIVRAIPPDVPNPTEAYEGFGDAVRAVFLFYVGVMASFVIACTVGVVAGRSLASRWGVGKRPKSSPAAD